MRKTPALLAADEAGATPRCPLCGRCRRRRRSVTPQPLPLFVWARDREAARQHCGRVVLLDNCRDMDGTPRAALILPGQRVPRAFPSIAAALQAQRKAEGWR